MKFVSLAALSAALCATLCSGSTAQVPFERIANADKEPGNWLTYSRNYQGQRFSPLNEINTSNVAKLKVQWALQFPAPTNEVSPIVVDNIMYVTGPNSAAAIDARTGRTLWTWKRPIPSDYHSVGEAGIRGFVDAYDAKSGEQAWRFWTIPGPGEPGHETWTGDSWKTGGGSTWVTGAFDPDLKLIYWGGGNPGPDWNGDARPGDNLYTCSLLALDADTGKLRWYFQFTPHETHDWDAAHVPILFDAKINGRERKLIANANRNAFYYVLDRGTGEFIAGRPYAKQTWARGLDSKGHPIVLPDTEPTEKGALVWPNANGATVWFSPSYSPQPSLFYVAVREIGSVYFKRSAEYKEGTFYAGGGEDELPADDASGEIRALDPTTGELRWEFKLHSPPWAGVLSTSGGLVFSGSDEGTFYALDARTGKPLWDFQSGGSIGANPISFNVDGHQRIAVSSNQVLYVFGL